MTEMVVPGTYITVRAEGLISAGRVATGIVGVVGTAANGPVGVPVTLSGLTDARARFGLSDSFDRPENGANPLTLYRALEHVYSNGAASVVAVRVAGSSQSNATFAVQDEDGPNVAVLSAKTPGTWANNIRIQVDPADADQPRVFSFRTRVTFDGDTGGRFAVRRIPSASQRGHNPRTCRRSPRNG